MTGTRGSITTPSCPSCDGPMILRKNRRDGTSFWGCRRYPLCRGTRDVGEDASESPAQVRVSWIDATLDRTRWQCRYTTAGGRLRSSPSLMDVSHKFRQCWIARTNKRTSTVSKTVRRVTGAIRKIIQRGSNPPIHPDAEREFLNSLGLGGYVRHSSLPGDISVRLEEDVFQDLFSAGLSLPGSDFERDDEVRAGI